MSYTKIMPRRGTKYEWVTKNPILAEGEMAVECPDSGIGTGLCRFKFGDGFRPYKELPYAFDGASASSMVGGSAFAGNTLQIRGDTHENWLLANPVLEEYELVWDSTLKCFFVGDGVSRFSQLEPAGRQLVYDFGDEDADLDVSGGDEDSSGVATLSDMLGAAVEDAGPSPLSADFSNDMSERLAMVDLVPVDDDTNTLPVGESLEMDEDQKVTEVPMDDLKNTTNQILDEINLQMDEKGVPEGSVVGEKPGEDNMRVYHGSLNYDNSLGYSNNEKADLLENAKTEEQVVSLEEEKTEQSEETPEE